MLIWIFLSRKPKGNLKAKTTASLGVCGFTLRIRSYVQAETMTSLASYSGRIAMDRAAHKEGSIYAGLDRCDCLMDSPGSLALIYGRNPTR